MKKVLLVIVVLSLMAVAQGAHAVYLDSSWYAQLTNVSATGGTYPSDPFNGHPGSSAHIGVASSYGTASFSIPQSGQASTGESASWGVFYVSPFSTMGTISFDYTTYWAQPNLVLELYSSYIYPEYGQSGIVWSASGTGLQSGHVTISVDPNSFYPNGYGFYLVAVPEPSSFSSLASLCASGMLIFLRRRTTGRAW